MADSLKHKTKVGAYWALFNQLANNGVIFLVSIVMARLLTPEDFGITALPAVFIAIADIFIESGFSSALVRKKELKEEDLSTAFYFSIGVGIICYFILFIASPFIAGFYNEPILKTLTRVTALSFLILPMTTPQTVIMKRNIDFKTPAKVCICSRVSSGILGIVMAYVGYGLWALVISNLTNVALTFVLNWICVRWYPKSGWSRESFRYLFGYGSKFMLTTLINRIYINITPLFIGKYFNTAQLGIYNTAEKYTNMPSRLLTGVVQNVTFPVLSKFQDNDDVMSRNYRKMIRLSSFVVFPVMIMLLVLAEPLIIVMVTDRWLSCVPYMQIMCLWVMWHPIHSLNLNLLLIKGRSDLFLKLEIYKTAIGLVIMLSTLPFGITYFLWGSVISSLISLYINTYYSQKLINVGFWCQIGDILPTLMLCGITGIIVYILTCFLDAMFLKLVFGGIFGLIIYMGGAHLLKRPELDDIKYMISKK